MFQKHALAAAVALSLLPVAPALAQSAGKPAPGSPDFSSAVVVTADPLGNASDLFERVTPASVVELPGLVLRRRSTLGETVSHLPGVSSTGFGPNASRPVIRGLEGDRIRLLQNGMGMIDASAASADHAVTVDPASLDRIEVVRGPAALLYGGNAVGGVVNVIDGRIPQTAARGLRASVEPRLGGPDDERGGSLRLDAGTGRFALHASAYGRTTGDLRIPGSPVSSRLQALSSAGQANINAAHQNARGRQPNSGQRSEGGSVGSSVVWDRGFGGLSFGEFNSNYGAVGEPAVRIDMQSHRWDAAGEVRELGGFFRTAKFKLGTSQYQHREINGGVVETTFRSSGHDLRLELQHDRIGPLQGVFGFQSGVLRLSAEGSEAFLPTTRQESNALFFYEELPLGAVRLSFGGRYDSVRAKSDPFIAAGTAADARRFGAKSGSIGALWPFTPGWALAANGNYTERAPTSTELYANGPHLATTAFEVGNRTLGKERSRALDLVLRKTAGTFTGSAGVFVNRFSNYVYLAPAIDPASGRQFYRDAEDRTQRDSDPTVWAGFGESIPEFNFVQVPATFRGFELEGRWRAWEQRGRVLDLSASADLVRATSNGQPLPRIPAAKIVLGADVRMPQGFAGGVEVIRVAAQNRIPTYPSVLTTNLPTDGYTLLNATLSYRFRAAADSSWELFARGTNLGNREARNHASFIKEVSPLPGRGLLIGLRGTL